MTFIGVSFVLARRCQPYALAAAAGRSETTGHIVDSVTNLSTARLFARLGFEREQLGHAQERELGAVLHANRVMERVRWFQFGAAAVLKVGMILVALRLWSRGAVTVGQFVMALSLSLLIIAEVRNLSRRFLEFFEFVGNVANGVRTIIRPHEVIDRPNAKDAASAPVVDGAIEFRDVDFQYADGKQVFGGLSIFISSGQRVGLVGFSGSGKSTFVSLLLRLHDPQAGAIFIDGHDLRSLTQDALHAQIGLIPQDPTLFHRSLRENIGYGRLRCERRRDPRGCRARPRPRVHHRDSWRLRRHGRGARRQALGRPAPAGRHREGDPQEHAGAHPRRGHLESRFPSRST